MMAFHVDFYFFGILYSVTQAHLQDGVGAWPILCFNKYVSNQSMQMVGLTGQLQSFRILKRQTEISMIDGQRCN